MRVEDLRDSALAPEPPDWVPTAIPLQPAPEGSTVQRLRLYASNVAAVVGRQEIDIAFATFGKRVPLQGGTVSVAGCVFSAPAGTPVENNALVRFVRSAQCPVSGESGPAAMALAMALEIAQPRALLLLFIAPPVHAASSPAIVATAAAASPAALTNSPV